MKKVIDGKIYNTDTAERLAFWCNDLPDNDFGSLDETLFRTKKGQHFLYGDGGALTWCSQRSGNGSCGGKVIELMSSGEALAWCERREINCDLVAALFEIVEG